MNSIGIVLRYSSVSHNKIALLDKQYGRIECIVNGPKRSVGTLLFYSMNNKQNATFLADIQLLYVPLSLASLDLLFLHHIFEVIYYFAPIGSCVYGVFDLLAFLYTVEHMLISMKFKKFFLFKLLMLLGITVDGTIVSLTDIDTLQTMTIDAFNEDLFDNEKEKKLDTWLWHCISQHPYVNEFKTVRFLEKNRAI